MNVVSHEATLDVTARSYRRSLNQHLEREQSAPITLQSQQPASPSKDTQKRNDESHKGQFNSMTRNIELLRNRLRDSQQRNAVSREAVLDSMAHNDKPLLRLNFNDGLDKPVTIKELHDFSLGINILEKEDIYRYF